MRPFLFAGMLLATLALGLASPGSAHDVVACEPRFVFPSLALWYVPAGGVASFYLPPSTFGSLASLGIVDVTLYTYATCAVDPTCHHHGIAGPMACGMGTRSSVLEIANHGVERVPVFLAVGQCLQATVCNDVI